MKKVQKGILLATFFVAQSAHAGVYSFGMGCTSMGNWTQAALSQMEEIRKAVTQLKDNPACKGMDSVLRSIYEAQSNLRPDSDRTVETRENRLTSLPGDMAALRTFVGGDKSLKTAVMKILADDSMNAAVLSAAQTGADGGVMAGGAAGGLAGVAAAEGVKIVAEGLRSLSLRSARSASTGLEMMTGLMDVLANQKECLIGQPVAAANLMAGFARGATAFMSAGEGAVPRLGAAISKFIGAYSSYLRDVRFTNVLKQLNKTEFWMSMSCLIESAQQNFCAAKDAQELIKVQAAEQEAKALEVQTDHPLKGYYILVKHAPVIADWLQRVQFGPEPQLSAIANYKNDIINSLQGFYKTVNSLLGNYYDDLRTLKGQPNLYAKKLAFVKLLEKAFVTMAGPMGFGGDVPTGPSQNFFTYDKAAETIPFFLLGIETPSAVISSEENKGLVVQPIDWFRNGGKFRPIINNNDPERLAEMVGRNIKTLIKSATTVANKYYADRIVADQPNLVVEALTNQPVNVYESLQTIQSYLFDLEKTVKSKGDKAIVPMIYQTRMKIQKVLDAFEEARRMGGINKGDDPAIHYDQKEDEKVFAAYSKVIEAAFEQFNIRVQQDSFLTQRLANLVYQDYVLRLRDPNTDLTKYQSELLWTTGKALYNRMVEVNGGNPSATEQDLSQAQVVSKRNLWGIEQLFAPSLLNAIEELNVVVGSNPSPEKLNEKIYGRLMEDVHGTPWKENYWELPHASQQLYWIFGPDWATYMAGGFRAGWNYHKHPERYPFVEREYVLGGDDADNSFKKFRNKLCVQTVGFVNRSKFRKFCAGAELNTAFAQAAQDNPGIRLNIKYDGYMSPVSVSGPVPDKNICAFRDFLRHNQVYWLYHDLPKNNFSAKSH